MDALSASPGPPEQPVSTLGTPHREILARAVANVLSSSAAKQTYGQIVDGLPLADVAWDRHAGCLCLHHPLLNEHKELCSGVAEETEGLLSSFDLGSLLMPSEVLSAYKSASLEMPGVPTRLIELVARAVHAIAAWLYAHDATGTRHKDDALGRWRPLGDLAKVRYPRTFPETLFCHSWYFDFDQYPAGIADSVGYWAEARILGGVLLFDRRDLESAEDVDPNAIYVHADRRMIIYRICRLLESQKEELVRFLLSEATPPHHCPLPILPDEASRQRVDPEQAIEVTGIYRDPWERRLRPLHHGDRRTKDVVDTFNYLSREDWRAAKLRGSKERGKREHEAYQERERLRFEAAAREAVLEEGEPAGRS